jgi:mono/diheme cytochrome c family protein
MRRRAARLALGSGVFWAVLAAPGLAFTADADSDDQADRFFRERVAPVFETRCVHCHGDSAPKGGLSLTRAAGVLKGGESGPAVVPGRPDESELLDAVVGEPPAMPKKGDRLTPAQVADLRAWVERGAGWPEGLVLRDRRFEAEGRTWWAFAPLARPAAPAVKAPSWARNPVDAFILARLEKEGLSPSPEADPRTLIRRLTYDLHGLPPTPAEVEAFLADPRPDAYERLVDRLLASPRYGERWGRHWLDVVHYGDTHGYDKDKRRDHAWPYRDYVIRSFNADRPYARFVLEQVAGDVLFPGEPDGVIATGFIAAGPWDFVGHVELREGTLDKAKTRLIDRDDMVASTVSTFQSLTAHCARCHDHKFDPIPQRDYYRLQAVFAGVDRGDRGTDGRVPDPKAPAASLVYAVVPHAPRPIHVLNRGDVEQPGEPVGPGALSCLPGLDPVFHLSESDGEGARRAALAGWLTEPANVLTWRSVVNRAWHGHFGRGIVDTPNDFGRMGSLPSHPELLDWLAVAFRDGGQSLKALHRLIVTSATYRQSSRHDPAASAKDADNRWLWRQNRRRLDAESVRDAILSVSGTLDPRMGGPGFDLFRFKDDHSPVYDHTAPGVADNPQVRRRTVYRFTVRSVPNPFLECMDCADPNINTPVRTSTITALQALALLNDRFVISQSECFARRVEALGGDTGARVDAAFLLALGRPPRPVERDALADFARKHGLARACRVLLNTNEFLFVD